MQVEHQIQILHCLGCCSFEQIVDHGDNNQTVAEFTYRKSTDNRFGRAADLPNLGYVGYHMDELGGLIVGTIQIQNRFGIGFVLQGNVDSHADAARELSDMRNQTNGTPEVM